MPRRKGLNRAWGGRALVLLMLSTSSLASAQTMQGEVDSPDRSGNTFRNSCEDSGGAACSFTDACRSDDTMCCISAQDVPQVGVSHLEHDLDFQACHGTDGTLRVGNRTTTGQGRVDLWFADKRDTWDRLTDAARALVPAPNFCIAADDADDNNLNYSGYACGGGVNSISDGDGGFTVLFECATGTCDGTSNACQGNYECGATCMPSGMCRGIDAPCTYADDITPNSECQTAIAAAGGSAGTCNHPADRMPGRTKAVDLDNAGATLLVPQCLFPNRSTGVSTLSAGCGGENLDLLGTSLPCAVNGDTYLSDDTKDTLGELTEPELGMILDAWSAQVQQTIAASGATCTDSLADPSCRTLDPAYWQTMRFVNDVRAAWETTQATDFVFVLDVSGSMGYDGEARTRLQRAIDMAQTFVGLLDQNAGHRVKVVTFTTDVDYESDDWEGVNGTPEMPGGDALQPVHWDHVPLSMTSIGDGMNAALNVLGDVDATNPNKVIILVTDGAQNTESCVSHPNAGSPTGSCPADSGAEADVTKQMIVDAGARVCSITVSTLSQVDYDIIHGISEAVYEGDTPEATFKGFLSCLNDRSIYQAGTDPSYLIPRSGVASAPFSEDVDINAAVSFVGGWEASIDSPGDMDMLVTLENGDLLTTPDAFPSDATNIQRVDDLDPQAVRTQFIRKHHRFINGFTSDAFEDVAAGTDLVRRQIQRLCPVAYDSSDEGRHCRKVLYFEDGRADASSLSVYREAIDAEKGKVLPSNEDTYVDPGPTSSCTITLAGSPGDEEGVAFTDNAKCLAEALEDDSWDLVVYAKQLEPAAGDQMYDAMLASTLCYTQTRAIITDTRATQNEDLIALGLCSGFQADPSRLNFREILDATGEQRLLDSTLALRACWDDDGDTVCDAGEDDDASGSCDDSDCGDYITSYGVAPLNWEAIGELRNAEVVEETGDPLPYDVRRTFREIAASVLEGSIADPGTVDFIVDHISGGIVATSMDRAFPLDLFSGSYAYEPPTRRRDEQRVFYQSELIGNLAIKGDSPQLTGSGLTAVLRSPLVYVPAGGFSNVSATVEITYPTMDIEDAAASELGCPSSTDADARPGSRSILARNIPTATVSYALEETDFNTWSVTVPDIGDDRGSYNLRYVFEADYVDGSGTPRTTHLEARESLFLGNADGSPLDIGTPGEDCEPADNSDGSLQVSDISTVVCSTGSVAVDPNVSYTGTGTVSGTILAVDGSAVGWDLAPGELVQVSEGTTVVRWVAKDASGVELASAVQTITVTATSDDDAACCADGQIVYEPWFSFLPNVVVRSLPAGYCIFAKGGSDVVVTGPVADTVLAGSGNDIVTNIGQDGVSYGGAGNDLFFDGFSSTTIYGGPGDDNLSDLGGGLAEGNDGDDVFFAWSGDHNFVGGPGLDRIYGSALGGDDTITIYDACEVVAGEVYEGGAGYNTLVSPISPADLMAMGVLVLNVDEWVSTCPGDASGCVDSALSHLSECR